MTEREASKELEDSDVVAIASASLDYCKDLLAMCLDDEIPAMLMRGEDERVQLLVREQDTERTAAMFDKRWREMAEQEGTFDPDKVQYITAREGDEDDEDNEADQGAEGELPCPACGTALPLVDGACSDCGLVLE